MVKILRTNIKNDENNTRVNLFYLLCFLVFFLFLKIYILKKIMTKKRRSKHLITLIVIIFGLVRFL